MKRQLILLLCLASVSGFSQENLVYNSGFEEFSANSSINTACCVVSGAGFNPDAYWKPELYHWGMPNNSQGTSDVYRYDNTFRNVVVDEIGNGGDYCGHTLPHEYITQKLKKPIIKDHFYYYEFSYGTSITDPSRMKSEALMSVGIKLFDSKPDDANGSLGSDRSANILSANFNGQATGDKMLRARGYFIGDKSYPETWIVLSPWYTDSDYGDSPFLVFWDNIKIVDLGPSLCPEELLFDNTVFDGGYESYQASNKIVLGEGADATASVHGPVLIKNNTDLVLKAGQIIELGPGVEIEAGSDMTKLEISGCIDQPCMPPTINPKQFKFCGNPDSWYLNGVFNENELNPLTRVTWSPAQYVDDPHALVPKFISPIPDGELIMNVRVETMCTPGIESLPSIRALYNQDFIVRFNQSSSSNFNVEKTLDANGEYHFVFSSEGKLTLGIGIYDQQYTTVTELEAANNYSYQWTFPKDKYVSYCENSNLLFVAQNQCTGDQVQKTDYIPADNSSFNISGVSNFVNMTDEVNDQLVVHVKGAYSYRTDFYSPSGGIGPFNKNGDNPEEGKIYGYPSSILSPKDCWADGTYYWTTEFYGCNGEFLHRQNGFFQYFNDCAFKSENIESDTWQVSNEEELDFTNTGLNLYPNPTTGSVSVEFDEQSKAELKVIDMSGKLVRQFSDVTSGIVIDLSDLDKGIYFITIVQNTGEYESKRIVLTDR